MTNRELLIADQFFHDPRVAEAKKLLETAMHEHQVKIKTVRPPNARLKQQYEDLINQFAKVRGNKLYYPFIGSGLGNGALVELLDGSVKYDFITGIGVHCMGHSHPELLNPCIDAAIADTVMQGNLQQNKDALDFCQLLIQQSGLDHCFLTTTGVMANENAIKMAFQKKAPASRILAFEKCFLGRSLAASQVTDKPTYREGLPINYQVDYIPFYDPAKPEESIQNSIQTLKKHLKRYPQQHAVMIMELVQGEGGFYPGTHQFFKSIISILKDHSIAVFIDEVQTFGRTSHLFAFQHFGLESYVDLVSIGKLSQVCATLYKTEYSPKPGLLSQTFTGSTSAIHAGKWIVQKLLDDHHFGPDGKNMQIYQTFVKHLETLSSKYPHLIEGPFGLGTMIAFTAFKGHPVRVNEFVQSLFENGVMSFIAGSDPTRVRFLAPFGVVTETDIQQAMQIVEETLIHFKPSL